jgi:hypothetical protein
MRSSESALGYTEEIYSASEVLFAKSLIVSKQGKRISFSEVWCILRLGEAEERIELYREQGMLRMTR